MRIGARGQVTIPKTIRHRFGLQPHDEVIFVESRGELILRKRRSPKLEQGFRKWIGRIGQMPESVDEFLDALRGA